MNIAIFSPNQNPYSETFIQAHKNYLNDKVFYYFGPKGYVQLEGQLSMASKISYIRHRTVQKLCNYPLSYVNQQSVLISLKKNAIDVVLVEYGVHAYNLYPILRASNLPIVVHFHGYDASVKHVIKKCENYVEVFQVATFVVVVSRDMERRLLALGCPKAKLIYNIYGPNPEFLKVIPKFSEMQFIGIGRFTDKKAPYYTILSFKLVSQKYPEAQLLLAGNGVLMNTCKNLVKQLKLQDQVQFLGVISPEQYRELLSESLAFVQHSITAENGDMEGTPLAVLEASVAGLPVISTNHAGIPDVIIHGETGLLCDEHNIEEMARNMIAVLDDVSYAQQLGAAGKEHITNNFNMHKHIQILQEALERAAEV
ncbi:glycosyltransferase [Gelidibacter sp. F2691]|nr:glycosyltransferase [Gelidibacter sp. F2691]